MSAGAGAAAGTSGAAAAQVIAEATKASGVIVRVSSEDFSRVLEMNDEPLVVHAMGGVFTKHHQYLTSYRGLAFFAKADGLLELPANCQVVEAKKIWLPA